MADEVNNKAILWSYSRRDGDVLRGDCATREAAIEEARGEYGDDVAFYVWQCQRLLADAFTPDVGGILERMGEAAGDEVGEAAEDYPDVSDEAQEELRLLLQAWTAHHAPCEFWQSIGEAERIEPVSAMAGAS